MKSKIIMQLYCKPFSINSYHYRDKRHKTKEAREWEEQMLIELDPYEKRLHEMAEDYNTNGGMFIATMIANYPLHIFLNKGGGISSKTIDITNAEKPVIDLIFGNVMGVNDKALVSMSSHKRPGSRYRITVILELHPNLNTYRTYSISGDPEEDVS